MQPNSVNVALIGCGYWGPNLIRNFVSQPQSNLIAICDQDAGRLASLKSQYPHLETTLDSKELMTRDDIDAIVIATPVSSHYPLALDALQAGKHVLVEKPIASSSAQAQELINVASEKELILMVDHTFAYTPAVRRIRKLVQEGDLGKPLYYDSVRINLGRFQHDTNVLWDLAVHDLAIMDYALGKHPTSVSATGLAHFAGQHEDVAYLTCFFEDDFVAHFHLNWLSPVKIRRTILGGDKKMIVYDDLEPSEKIKIYDSGADLQKEPSNEPQKARIDYRIGDMAAPHISPEEALKLETSHFISCILNKEVPETDGHAGLRVLQILEAANKSLKNNGSPEAV
ncbi:Gfo/Idh/MocA family oxidoreductase [Rubellicoccus peritrichatus]|uniref:Gfo/Idh/MocA family oxidoreductase n=1 Tax=Rubellicoccus peritrichatus TaxID=3080537 RepID=A0AAQ3LFR0_9BACT|nr:Gfo/Idh/MocA family oxidoreductase [Puniceicoccus sp. CR14]WOO42958.1 Gfo/Idh/MocA family oxidoreductase [Puniceicoccus sp. CR14]